MKSLTLILILVVGTAIVPSRGLSFQKVEKDLNGIKDDEDLEFTLKQFPKPRRQAALTASNIPPGDLQEQENIIPEVEDNKNIYPQVESGTAQEPKIQDDDQGKVNIINDEQNNVDAGQELNEMDKFKNPEPELLIANPNIDKSKNDSEETESVINLPSNEPTIFALANTHVGRSWEGIPFRERYLWTSHSAPCHPFNFSIPHGGSSHKNIRICLYRKEISSPEHPHSLTTIPVIDKFPETEKNVFGFVIGHPKSSVEGNIRQGNFVGRIIMGEGQIPSNYVVEDVSSLAKLLSHSEKLLHNLLIVINSANGQWSKDSKAKFNAIVTAGTSLESFVPKPLPGSVRKVKPSPFLAVNTGHNSFIFSGEPLLSIDEKGRTIFTIGEQIVTLGDDATVSLAIKSKDEEYKFRPNGQSILMRGLNVTSLEHQEAVAVFAVSSALDYGCIIPSPAFSNIRNGGFVCKVCVGLDNSFVSNFKFPKNYSEKDVYEFVGEMLDQVAWIFRSVDWNNDGTYDNLGISYDPQIFSKDYTEFPEFLSAEQLEKFYEDLAKLDFSDCCLGILYTMKQFPGDLYAKSSLEKPGAESGICAFKRNEGGIWNNAILISGNNKQGASSPMTPDQLLYLTAHEIGKAFGGNLDATGDPKCDSFQDATGIRRHFLLWPDVTRSVSMEEQAFSPCSLEDIHKVLDTCHSSCFEMTDEPFCGNGIVEMGEECDCGSEIQCAQNPCCFPRNGKYPCQSTGLKCLEHSGSIGRAPIEALPILSLILAITNY